MDRIRGAPTSYADPFLWWGPVWEPPPARTIIDLIRDEVMTPAIAALLWAMLARRASIIVAAGPRGVGKTTVLTALIDCYPPATRRLYLRGCYESFAFLDDDTIDPARSVLLVNEISSHLPGYLWGPGVRRLLQAADLGFTFAATAHATSIEGLVGQLAGYPLHIPVSELAAIDVAVLLGPGPSGAGWRVDQVWAITRQSQRGLTVDPLADRHDISHNLDVHATHLSLIPTQAETSRRAEYLAELAQAEQGVAADQIPRALLSFRD